MGNWRASQRNSERCRLRDVSTQMPIAGVDDMAQGRFPRVSRHPEQCCCERQYKEKGQLLAFAKESPKHAAGEENQESQEPE